MGRRVMVATTSCRPRPGPSSQALEVGPVVAAVTTETAGGRTLLRFTSKMLRQLGKVRMTAEAKRLVKTFLAGLYRQVLAEAERLRCTRQLPAAGAPEVRVALQRVMPRVVAKVAGHRGPLSFPEEPPSSRCRRPFRS